MATITRNKPRVDQNTLIAISKPLVKSITQISILLHYTQSISETRHILPTLVNSRGVISFLVMYIHILEYSGGDSAILYPLHARYIIYTGA